MLAWIPVPQDPTTKWCQQLLFPTNRKLNICHCSARGSCSAVNVLRNLNGTAIDGINGCRGNLHATLHYSLPLGEISRNAGEPGNSWALGNFISLNQSSNVTIIVMEFGMVKSTVGFLLLLNFCMYVSVAAIAGLSLNNALDHAYSTGTYY